MNEKAPVVVLVTLQRHCARLIRSGADMALKERCPLKVVHVAKAEGMTQADILNDLYALANEAGAEMCVLMSEDMVAAAAEYAGSISAKRIVMGAGERAQNIAEALSGLLPGVRILILEPEQP